MAGPGLDHGGRELHPRKLRQYPRLRRRGKTRPRRRTGAEAGAGTDKRKTKDQRPTTAESEMHVRSAWMVVLGIGVAACGGGVAPEEVAPVRRAARATRTGLEVLLGDSTALVAGKRVGLVTNQSGVDATGVSGVDRLRSAGIALVALFSPEHGFRGNAEAGEAVASTVDSATRLPIYSLYGRNRVPADSVVRSLDVLLVDLQDAGARYYTYLATTVDVMRAAQSAGRTVVVLDRPNPIGGMVQGNVLDTAWRTDVGLLAIPMRHAMAKSWQ